MTEEQEKLINCKIDLSTLESLGFPPCKPLPPFEAMPLDLGILAASFNNDGLYSWYGFKKDSKGLEWYVVFNNILGGWYFQRQVEIKTVGDLLTVYKNSTGEYFSPNFQFPTPQSTD